MAIKGGFFNSDNGDRKYDAEDINEFFDGLINEGVFSTIGDSLFVTPGTGLQVVVGSGRAWFLKSWLVNTADTFLSIDAADLTYARIDIIALDFDKRDAYRENSIVVVKGTPSGTPTPPTLINSEDHKQVPLAYLDVAANATSFTQGDLTNKIGTANCPFVTAVAEHISIEDLLVQWRAEFDVWMDYIEQLLSEIDTGAVLDRLDEMDKRPIVGRNLIINGDMQICQRSQSEEGFSASGSSGLYGEIADRWRINLLAAGTWDLSRGTYGGSATYRIDNVSPIVSPLSTANFRITQEIEAEQLGELLKGTVDAREMTLSFDFKTNKLGNYIVEVIDKQNSWSISSVFTVVSSGSWEHYSIVIPKESTQPITSATMSVSFWFVAGSNYTSGGSLQSTWGPITTNKRAYGQVNLASTLYNYVEFTNVQLELGSVESVFERVPYNDALRMCQRYYEYISTANCVGVAIDSNTLYFYGSIPYGEKKRGLPTINVLSGTTTYPAGHTLTNFQALITGRSYDAAFFSMDISSGTMTPGYSFICSLLDFSADIEIYET